MPNAPRHRPKPPEAYLRRIADERRQEEERKQAEAETAWQTVCDNFSRYQEGRKQKNPPGRTPDNVPDGLI